MAENQSPHEKGPDEGDDFEAKIWQLQERLAQVAVDIAEADACAAEAYDDLEKGYIAQQDYEGCVRDLIKQLNKAHKMSGSKLVVVGGWRQVVVDEVTDEPIGVRSVPVTGVYTSNGFNANMGGDGPPEFGLSFIVGEERDIATTYYKGTLNDLAFAKLDEVYLIPAD